MAKQKNFLCKFNVTNCDTEINFFYIDQGKNEEEVIEKNEVEHDACGLDTEESPVGGCIGEKCTELCNVYPITESQKKFLNSVGIF